VSACTANQSIQTPLTQRAAIEDIDASRAACLATDGGCVVLHCLKICLSNGLTPPAWLSGAFIQRFDRVVSADVKTWDDAFGSYWPPRTRLTLKSQKARIKREIYMAARSLALSNLTAPIGRDFFELLCEKHNFGKAASTVERYYYECVREGLPNLLALRANVKRQYLRK
jgi:hypothetical protein